MQIILAPAHVLTGRVLLQIGTRPIAIECGGGNAHAWGFGWGFGQPVEAAEGWSTQGD